MVGGVRSSLGKRLRAPQPAAGSLPQDGEHEEELQEGRAGAFEGGDAGAGQRRVSLKQQLVEEARHGGGKKKKKKKKQNNG